MTRSVVGVACLTSLLISLLASLSYAQDVGDRVVVVATFETKIRDRKVDKVFEGAIHTLIAENGNWVAVNDVRGWLHKQNVMSLPKAYQLYTGRIQNNPRDSTSFAHRGMIHFEFDRYPEALADLNKAYQLAPSNLLVLNNMSKVLNAQGRYEEAVNLLTSILKRNDQFPLAWFNLGLTYFAMNNNEKAIESFDKAIAMKADQPWYFVSRGSAHLNSGAADQALADYDSALKLNPKISDAFVGKSNVYLQREDFATAYKFANLAVQTQPRNATCLNARGWVLYRQNKLQEAVNDYSQAIRVAPRLPVSYNNRGVAYAEAKKYDLAIRDYDQAIQLSQSAPVTFANRGTAKIGTGDYQGAKVDLEKALELAPMIPDANNALAWFLSTCPEDSLRDGARAVELAEQANEPTEHKNWTFVDTLAAAHAEAGDFDAAVEWASKALELAPQRDKATCQEHLELFQSKQPLRSQQGKSNRRAR